MHVLSLVRAAKFSQLLFVCVAVQAYALLGLSGAASATELNPKDWSGFGWGLGIAVNFDPGGKQVGKAVIDQNKIVRVTDTSSNASVSFVLEAHYFIFDRKLRSCPENSKNALVYSCTEYGHGPFVAVEIGGGNDATTNSGVISGYALGWMVGLRHLMPDGQGGWRATATPSWNIGLGLRITPKAKVLADGVIANQPFGGTEAFLIREEPRVGVMLMSTFSF